ncbi:hypothetical protein [Methylomonas sp. CM2]|uniref:hypothetical protein n=1 Tax=Methylomonas sp. CM2 TaxID=3417647 RepID=UPI003CFAC587
MAVTTILALAWLYPGKQPAVTDSPVASAGSVKTQTAKPASRRTDATMPDFDSMAGTMAAAYTGDGHPSETENWSQGIASDHRATQQLLAEASSTGNGNLSPRTEQLRQKEMASSPTVPKSTAGSPAKASKIRRWLNKCATASTASTPRSTRCSTPKRTANASGPRRTCKIC